MRRLGDFLLFEEIGRGGMGKVYHARQVSLEREVALKVLPSMAGLDPDSVTRFRREAEAAGRLSHPGIVPIYAVGEVGDTYFYAMELVDGPSLFDALQNVSGRAPNSLRGTFVEETQIELDAQAVAQFLVPDFLSGAAYAASCASIILELCGALTVAHQGQVVHRDVKPSNILMHPAGRPVLVDFGLAQDELQLGMTQTGEAVGTPAYMAPEQASGARDLDARVDVYGLGVTLYEMLTLRAPFEGETAGEVMRSILDDEPVPPRHLNPRIPRALETIVLHAMAKDRDKRYASAADLGKDLRAFLTGGEIEARPPGVLERVSGSLRRNRRGAWMSILSVATVLIVLFSGGIVSLGKNTGDAMGYLELAKGYLLQGQVALSGAAFAMAGAALDDPEVLAEHRLRCFQEVFAELYPSEKHHPTLEEFIRSLPADEQDHPDYHAFRRKLSGIGHVLLTQRLARSVQKSYRRATEDQFDQRWRRLQDDGALKHGDYLVRLALPRMAPLVFDLRVKRDAGVVLDPVFKPLSVIPKDSRLIARLDGHDYYAVERHELTHRRYGELLATLDEDLRAELGARATIPRDTNRPSADLPVTGLSFRQMRTIAALLGGHLMTAREFRRAATGGLRLRYPWGHTFDLSRVVGDPRYTSGLAAVGSTPGGASPTELLDMVGNAGEILAADRNGGIFFAGGYYGSERDHLTVDRVEELPGPDTRDPRVGMRVARFVPGEDDGRANGWVESTLESLRASHDEVVQNTWRLDEQGQVELVQRYWLGADVERLPFPPLPGFRHKNGMARSTAGVVYEIAAADDGRHTHEILLGGRRGDQGVRISVHRLLQAVTGIHARLDAYVFHVPFVETERGEMARVELPSGSHVDRVWPPPDRHFYLDGRPVMVWLRPAAPGVAGQVPKATISFRRDGPLTARWPAAAPVERFVQQVMKGLVDGDRVALEPMLAEDWVASPQGWGKEETLKNLPAFAQYGEIRCLDVTAVGEVLTVELSAHRRNGTLDLPWWPLRMVLQRTPTGLRALRLQLSTQLDVGEVDRSVYRHQGMGVRVGPHPEIRMVRRHAGICPLQLECRPPAAERLRLAADHWVSIVGCIDDQSGPEAVRARLAAGFGPDEGMRIERTRAGTPGPEGRESAGAVEELAISTGDRGVLTATPEHRLYRRDGSWTRELRGVFTLGNRHLMVRWVAAGRTEFEAKMRFERYQQWFATITRGIRIE